MTKLPKEFKKELLESYLELHWSKWNSLGVQTHIHASEHFIDIEALLISTFFSGTLDKRLFLSMIEWLDNNREWVSVSRIKNMLKFFQKENFKEDLLKPADLLVGILGSKDFSKKININTANEYEKILANYERRGMILKPLFNKKQVIQLYLRGIFGINARADIIFYLLSEHKQNVNKLSREIYYDQKIVYRIMQKWEKSGIVSKDVQGKEILYSLVKREIFFKDLESGSVKYMNWLKVFVTLRKIIDIVISSLYSDDEYLLSSQLRKIYPDIASISGYIDLNLEKERNFPGEELFSYLKDPLLTIFKRF